MKRLLLALALVWLCGSCVTAGAVREARAWSAETAVDGEVTNPKISFLWATGLVIDLDGVEGSGRVTKKLAGPATRPAG